MYSGEATSDAKGASDPGAGAMVWSGAHRVNASSDEVSAFDDASHGAAMAGPGIMPCADEPPRNRNNRWMVDPVWML